MNFIKRKLHSLNLILFKNKITPSQKMGDKLLFLAPAPCVGSFFEKQSVREQFKGYDLAFINFMVLYMQKELFEYKPKYLVLMDPLFYSEIELKTNKVNEKKRLVKEVLEKIDWECYIITSVLAEFGLSNPNVKFIRLSCFMSSYKGGLLPLFKKNWLCLGVNNVIQAAIFFGITFGYKELAILGCTYKAPGMTMKEDGLHILGYDHYYDLNRRERVISNEELERNRGQYMLTISKKSIQSSRIFWDLNSYAKKMNCNVINYSEGSMIDSIKMGKLND